MRLLALATAFVALVCGCAKFPDDPTQDVVTRLIFTMIVDREINSDYVYIVALRPTIEENPTDSGPIPVIRSPWGNGFVAGNVTVFVRWDPLQSPNFILYRFQGADLIDFFPIGAPVSFDDVEEGDAVLRFELDLNQIAANPQEAEQLRTLQVNFLTMDRVPQGTDTGSKVWDALGDSRLPSEVNDFVQIPLDEDGVYDDARFADLEPVGDTPDPDLDIIDWSIEVRRR